MVPFTPDMQASCALAARSEREVDVVIVGGGFSGSVAAVVLGRMGCRVAMIDIHAVYPPDFRCEKVAGDQLDLLRGLDLLECIKARSTPIRQMFVARFGKLVERKDSEEHGFVYDDMVRAVRGEIPASVEFIVGRVADVSAGPERQRVTLSNGEVVTARLMVLASGLGDTLRQKLGIRRRTVRDGHCLTIGFNILPAAGHSYGFPALTYYAERPADMMAYIAIFPLGGVLRANLFCYRGHDGSWARAFREAPQQMLFEAMPGLRDFLGDFQVAGKVKLRKVDLYTVEHYRRDGVVLIGDAFQTTCPAAGTGVNRALTDVGRLRAHLPRWLATPGMGVDKIAQFYDDPIKRDCDVGSAAAAEYCRSFSTDPGLLWRARRARAFLRPLMRDAVAVLARSSKRARDFRQVTTASRASAADAKPSSLSARG